MMQNKTASAELLSLIKAASESLQAFGTLWNSIKKKGADEGFTEPELQTMLRPLLKNQLGMSKDRIYYLFHNEEVKEKQRERDQNNRKIPRISPNKEQEQSYSAQDFKVPEDLPVTTIDNPIEKEPDYEAEYKRDMQQQQQQVFTKEDIDINTVVFRMGIKDYKRGKEFISKEMSDFINKELPSMMNRGWRTVEVTIKVVA